MKALVGAFNQEKALVGAFSVIVQPVVEPMEHYTALVLTGHRALGRDCDIRAALGAVGIYLVVFLLSDLTLSPS